MEELLARISSLVTETRKYYEDAQGSAASQVLMEEKIDSLFEEVTLLKQMYGSH